MARFLFVGSAVVLKKKNNIISVSRVPNWMNADKEEERIIPAKTIGL